MDAQTVYMVHAIVITIVQGRQTRQNSGGVADLTKGGYKIFKIFTR